MLAKAESDNKILMQLINHHNKTVKATKNKVSTNVQMLTLFLLLVSQLLIKLYKFMIRFGS
jgi:hypothetical protein